MFIYSAIKIKANNELLYSILNPDTSSDSPSVKSNGVRWVSAKIEIITYLVTYLRIYLLSYLVYVSIRNCGL